MKVALVGAIDRYNYGDVLFPLIVEEVLRKNIDNIEFSFYGYKDSELTRYGAHPTKTIKGIDKDTDAIIVVGGEVLTSSWIVTYLHSQENYFISGIFSKLRVLLSDKLLDSITKKLMGYRHQLPWIFEKEFFPETTVIYNSVGGASNPDSVNLYSGVLTDKLNEATYISVREEASKINLSSIGVRNVQLFPDSAFIMSDIYSNEILESKISVKVSDFHSPYIVFQIGKKYAKNNIKTIVEQLSKFLRNNEYQIVLLPIGYAALHEDYIPLAQIYSELKKQNLNDKVTFITENTIFDTMYIIANSELFVGTSLHGNVTALSYGKPSVGLDPRVGKLNELLSSFSISQQSIGVDYDNINEEIVKSLEIDKKVLINNSKKIKNLVYDNFNNIIEILNKLAN